MTVVELSAFPARFASKVEIDGNDCWLWTASLRTGGYGQFWDGQRLVRAHRFSYMHLHGAVPPGLELDHLCRVRRCVNPAHLEPVTSSENSRRSPLVGKHSRPTRAQCPRGHELPSGGTCQNCRREARQRLSDRVPKPDNSVWSIRTSGKCRRGHSFEADNVVISTDGRRRCRACSQRRALESGVRRAARRKES